MARKSTRKTLPILLSILLFGAAAFIIGTWIGKERPSTTASTFEEQIINPIQMNAERHWGAIDQDAFVKALEQLDGKERVWKGEATSKGYKILLVDPDKKDAFDKIFFNRNDARKYDRIKDKPATMEIYNAENEYGLFLPKDEENQRYLNIPYDVLMGVVQEGNY